MPLLNRRIILINDNDRLFLIVLMQHQRKKLQRHLIRNSIRFSLGQEGILLLLITVESRTVLQFNMALALQRNQPCDLSPGFFP